MDATEPRPGLVTEAHLQYLDDLRLSGVTNMYGAGPYLQREFGVGRTEAHTILGYWMRSYGERHPRGA